MDEAFKQVMNYIIIPVILGGIAICYRGYNKIHYRQSNPMSIIEKAVDQFGDINPDFSTDDAIAHSLRIVNSNIIIIDTPEVEENCSESEYSGESHVSFDFDNSDGTPKDIKEKFEELKDIQVRSEPTLEELDPFDLLEELEPSNPDDKERFHKQREFFSRKEFIEPSQFSDCFSNDTSENEEASFYLGKDGIEVESVESFFKQ